MNVSIFHSIGKWMTRVAVLPFLLPCVYSCEKSLDYQLLKSEPEPVLYAFPMPDSAVKVHASYSTSILSDRDFDDISNLKVKVKLGAESVVKEYPLNTEWLKIPELIGQGGDQFEVSYQLSDGRVVSGSSIIPEAIQIKSIDTTSVSVVDEENKLEEMLSCQVEFNDPLGEVNYYQIRVDVKKWIQVTPDLCKPFTESISFIKDDKVFVAQEDEPIFLSGIDFQGTFSDFLFDGENYKVKLKIPSGVYEYQSGIEKCTLEFYLFALTSEYYNHMRSSIISESNKESPFYNRGNGFKNVSNGLGVIAGLSVHKDSVVMYDDSNKVF
jgi:hypothetical protein